MTSINLETNLSQIRSLQNMSENHNVLQIPDDCNGYHNLTNHILDFPQRIKMASDFMTLETQVNFLAD